MFVLCYSIASELCRIVVYMYIDVAVVDNVGQCSLVGGMQCIRFVVSTCNQDIGN